MDDGSCCTTPNQGKTECCDKYNNGVAKDGSCCPALETAGCETETDETTGCTICKVERVENCSGKEVGTLCSDNGKTGMCAARGFCFLDESCPSGTKLYKYYPLHYVDDNVDSLGEPYVYCCANDPSTSPFSTYSSDGSRSEEMCCETAGTYPYFYMGGGGGGSYWCLEGETQATNCYNRESLSVDKVSEEMLGGGLSGAMACDYSYCPGGVSTWRCDYYQSDDVCYVYVRDCLE